MRGEILRRMSLETIKAEGVERENPVKKEVDRERVDEDDYLVKTIGAFGLWQAVVSVIVALTRVIAIWNIMSIIFMAPVVDFVCVEFGDNVTTEVINSTCYDNCVKYNYSSVTGRSVIEDFELICQNTWVANLAQTILTFGLLVGASVFGWISDRFGRRTALLISTFLNGVSMISLPFSPSYIFFTFIRFMIGIATGASLLICVVQIMEIIGKQYREAIGACWLIPDGLAVASLAGFSYYTSNWQGYTLSYGIATCVIFVLLLFIPESPRWLVSRGKLDEAIKVITCAANRNNLSTSHIKDEITKVVEDLKLNDGIVKASYSIFFTSKKIFILTLTVFLMSFALGMYCYSIYEYVILIHFDTHLLVMILGLIQIPVCPIGFILNWKFGRRISISSVSIATAVIMLILFFIPMGNWPESILGVIAIICCNISISLSYIHVSELYPTTFRSMGFALSLSGACIGVILASFISGLSPRWLPSLIFCLLPILAGLCCFTLAETKGQNLKDTIIK